MAEAEKNLPTDIDSQFTYKGEKLLKRLLRRPILCPKNTEMWEAVAHCCSYACTYVTYFC